MRFIRAGRAGGYRTRGREPHRRHMGRQRNEQRIEQHEAIVASEVKIVFGSPRRVEFVMRRG